ncbi:MAG: MFS transporter [Phenylobacterium sp.]|uniref:MFS transporter n=1 Tax=Phenylobacterium sp. TaxID=1871053 RepID=UPI0027323A09|nr:MFS transporter [Phenylobacterium sp.]MDP3175702.1 MFS transporter [Phenylobacterium sp.]
MARPPIRAPKFMRGATLAPFEHRIFAAVWTASLVVNCGAMIQNVGAAWLMTTLAPSPDFVALVQAAAMAPMMLLSLPAGALADTFDRRKVMMAAQIAMLLASAALAALAWLHMINAWSLLAFTFLIGCGITIYSPSWQSSIIEQVSREKLPAAVALNSVSFNLARSAAPALGGAIVAMGGSALAFSINAVSYISLIGVLAAWKRTPPEARHRPETLGRAMRTGVHYVLGAPAIRTILIRSGMLGFCAAVSFALLPLVARDLLKGGPVVYGVLLAGFGGGAMLMGLASVRLRTRFGGQHVMDGSCLAFALAMFGVAISPWYPTTFLFVAGAGGAWVLVTSALTTAVQTSSAGWVAGRVLSMQLMVMLGGMSVGSIVWGQVAHHIGLRPTFVAAAALLLATQAVARWLLPRTVDDADLDPADLLASLPDLDIDPKAGPIDILVEYSVDPKLAPAFMAAARELGAVRRRDGASTWTLHQDLDDPEIWIEQFSHPTWLDHQRRHARLTKADLAIRDRVLAFHSGAPLRIRRWVQRPSGAGPLNWRPLALADDAVPLVTLPPG